LEEEKESLGGHPDGLQEGTSRDSQHCERAEMMIVRLSLQRSFFSRSRRLRRLAGISQPSLCLRKNDGEFRPLSMETASQRHLSSQALGGDPHDQQKRTEGYGKREERAEIVVVRLAS
jgi:hypothetical protein